MPPENAPRGEIVLAAKGACGNVAGLGSRTEAHREADGIATVPFARVRATLLSRPSERVCFCRGQFSYSGRVQSGDESRETRAAWSAVRGHFEMKLKLAGRLLVGRFEPAHELKGDRDVDRQRHARATPGDVGSECLRSRAEALTHGAGSAT
jgi:hypothetical protein